MVLGRSQGKKPKPAANIADAPGTGGNTFAAYEEELKALLNNPKNAIDTNRMSLLRAFQSDFRKDLEYRTFEDGSETLWLGQPGEFLFLLCEVAWSKAIEITKDSTWSNRSVIELVKFETVYPN
jgi:hypothetical protein